MAVDATPRGFTLIELMIALAIAALLVMLGLPSFTEFLRNSEIRSTTESLVNGLRVARTEAIRRNQLVIFALASTTDPSWSVKQVSDDSTIQEFSKAEGGTHTTVTPAPAAEVSVTFNGMGRICPNPDLRKMCVPAVATDPLTQLDISSTIAPGARSLRIVLPVDGGTQGIRTCDPALTSTADPRGC
jgi:type IV fimbrial biogenesis protein FimT